VAAQRAAGTFLDRVPDRLKVGLVTFSDGADVVVAPTDDHDTVRSAVDSLAAGGATAIGDAIAASARLGSQGDATLAADRNGEDAPLVVLLLSDGEPSPDTMDPLQAAEEAQGQGVRIYTVALGTDEGTVTLTDQLGNEEVVPVPPDRETLSQIAELSGGQFFDAPSEQALEQVYAELGSDVGSKEEKTDVTWAFAGAGALLLLAGGLLSAFWFNRLP
jgi:Ca-activated chloride channel family protein